jgi:hypothetical protein
MHYLLQKRCPKKIILLYLLGWFDNYNNLKEIKAKLSLYLIKHCDMNTYGVGGAILNLSNTLN